MEHENLDPNSNSFQSQYRLIWLEYLQIACLSGYIVELLMAYEIITFNPGPIFDCFVPPYPMMYSLILVAAIFIGITCSIIKVKWYRKKIPNFKISFLEISPIIQFLIIIFVFPFLYN